MKKCQSYAHSYLLAALVVFASLNSFGFLLADENPLPGQPLPIVLPTIYAVQGASTTIAYGNLVLNQDPSKYQFKTECEVGHAGSNGWTLEGENLIPGTYPIAITVTGETGKSFQLTSNVLVSQPRIKRKSLSLLIVGDSLTNATHYANRIAELLSENDSLRWKMIGTNKSRNAAKGVLHEGYGGRTWSWFLNHYEPAPDGTVKKRSSPFVFLQSDGQSKIDLKKYFQKVSGGAKPDVITILLGVNDCFTASANPDQLAAKKISAMFENADQLIQEFRKACPDAKIGLCVTPPPNRRPEAFVASYQGKYPRDGWTQVLRQLQKEQIRRWADAESDSISLIPIHLNLDTTNGFPEDNALHPNKIGYRQIGDSIYAWICAHL